ncbi:MAG TPA: PadR family transcriptional regulator, partial [Thermoleophilaceae bacterium]
MSIQHAVLGLVIERPGYGYELAQRLEERVGNLRASKAAVYPALRKLEADEFIREREDQRAAAGVPAYKTRTWYEATDAGKAHLHEWIQAPTEPAPLRDELQIKIAFASVDELPGLVEQTRELEKAYLARIEGLDTRTDVAALRDPNGGWRPIGEVWLRRT